MTDIIKTLRSLFSEYGISFEDFCFEFESSKKCGFADLTYVKLQSDDKSICISSEICGYKFDFVLNKKDTNLCVASASLEPTGDIDDKIHRITSIKMNYIYDEQTCVLTHENGMFSDGIRKLDSLKESFKSVAFYSQFDNQSAQNAFTIAASMPAKFKSEIVVNKSKKDFTLSLDTIIPYTFEGKIICQEWNIYFDTPLTEALEDYAQRFSVNKDIATPIGWSTWDYYFTSATEDDVKQNVDFIASDEILSKKVKYIALDDGWQQREGDWRCGIRYPNGLKAVADYIKSKGFEPGIWIAPTRLHFLCATIMRRHAFLVRNEFSDPVCDDDMFILDPTHPDGEAFLRDCFTYLAECGFTFYKLDFVSNLLEKAERFYDKSAGPHDALRKLFEIARSCVPEGSHIMGCSYPYLTGPDHVDSRRTGWDIHNTWDHIEICLPRYLAQYSSGGKIYRNDIDYLVIRGSDTTDDPMTNVLDPTRGEKLANPNRRPYWRAGDDFNYEEAKSWCTSILLSGSSIFMSDNLPLINEKGIELIKTTIENADFKSATPIINGDETVPEIWYKKELQKFYIINFSRTPKNYCIPVSEYISCDNLSFKDIYTNTIYKLKNECIEFILKSHDSMCLIPNCD